LRRGKSLTSSASAGVRDCEGRPSRTRLNGGEELFLLTWRVPLHLP
jgi:hypothetical protein